MARQSASLGALLVVACATLAAAAPASGDAAVERFRDYLRIRTAQPTPDYVAAAAFLKAQALDIGCAAQRCLGDGCTPADEHPRCARLQVELLEYAPRKPHVLMTWPGRDASLPSIMLNSHTDVVPAEASFWRRAVGLAMLARSVLTRLRPCSHDPFAADIDAQGRIFARGSQDMKCVGLQYLEAIRRLKAKVRAAFVQPATRASRAAFASQGFAPLRTVLVTFVPDEEIGGNDGMGGFVASARFAELNVGLELDEGWATPGDVFPVFYAERCPWWFTIRAEGEPGHGSKLYDGGAMERLQAALARIFAFREQQFDKIKVRAWTPYFVLAKLTPGVGRRSAERRRRALWSASTSCRSRAALRRARAPRSTTPSSL